MDHQRLTAHVPNGLQQLGSRYLGFVTQRACGVGEPRRDDDHWAGMLHRH